MGIQGWIYFHIKLQYEKQVSTSTRKGKENVAKIIRYGHKATKLRNPIDE